MASSVEEVNKSVRAFMKVFAALIILTFITVGLSMVEMPTHSMNILVGMIVAAIKASLVGLIFMHLNHERSTVYKILAFTGVFAIVLFVLIVLAHGDRLVDPNF
tara:strand:- start:72 stop:383 length:312 start_codon:yes stop_codon:yes gene_type:complete